MARKSNRGNRQEKANPINSRRVFISHTMDDRPILYSAMEWLQHSDLRLAEVDDPAKWGARAEDPRKTISEKIRQADTVVLVWSDKAADSAWVQYDIGMAQALGVPIRVLLAGGPRSKL